MTNPLPLLRKTQSSLRLIARILTILLTCSTTISIAFATPPPPKVLGSNPPSPPLSTAVLLSLPSDVLGHTLTYLNLKEWLQVRGMNTEALSLIQKGIGSLTSLTLPSTLLRQFTGNQEKKEGSSLHLPNLIQNLKRTHATVFKDSHSDLKRLQELSLFEDIPDLFPDPEENFAQEEMNDLILAQLVQELTQKNPLQKLRIGPSHFFVLDDNKQGVSLIAQLPHLIEFSTRAMYPCTWLPFFAPNLSPQEDPQEYKNEEARTPFSQRIQVLRLNRVYGSCGHFLSTEEEAALTRFTQLRELKLDGMLLYPSQIKALQCKETLEQLELPLMAVTDKHVLAFSEFKKLTHLTLHSQLKHGSLLSPLTDAGLEPLNSLPNLTHLDIKGARITASAFQDYYTQRSQLQSLRLGFSVHLSEELLTAVAHHSPSLVTLILEGGIEKGINIGAQLFNRFPKLNRLELGAARSLVFSNREASPPHPNLRTLILSPNTWVTTAFLADIIAHYPHLEVLHFYITPTYPLIDHSAFAIADGLKHLRELRIKTIPSLFTNGDLGVAFTDKAIEALLNQEKLPHLAVLELTSSEFSDHPLDSVSKERKQGMKDLILKKLEKNTGNVL